MSFLDNLESDLKNLEKQEDRDPEAQKQRKAKRESVLAAAPWASGVTAKPAICGHLKTGHRERSKTKLFYPSTQLKAS